MSEPTMPLEEIDPRFPSGSWIGYFLMPHTGRKRYPTDLKLKFQTGVMTGTGRDFVGLFTVQGTYELADGKCRWTKHYLGKHEVFYNGFNEGCGIWGTWEIPSQSGTRWHGGFHIWPESIGDQSLPALAEAAAPPVEQEQLAPVGEALECL